MSSGRRPAVVQKQRRLQGQTTGLASASGGGWQVSTSPVTHTHCLPGVCVCVGWYSVLLYHSIRASRSGCSALDGQLGPGPRRRRVPACLLVGVGSCCVTDLGRCVGFRPSPSAGRPASRFMACSDLARHQKRRAVHVRPTRPCCAVCRCRLPCRPHPTNHFRFIPHASAPCGHANAMHRLAR